MNEEEINNVKEMYLKKAKELCIEYQEKESEYKDEITDMFFFIKHADTRINEIHRLIQELQMIENRIHELDKLLIKSK